MLKELLVLKVMKLYKISIYHLGTLGSGFILGFLACGIFSPVQQPLIPASLKVNGGGDQGRNVSTLPKTDLGKQVQPEQKQTLVLPKGFINCVLPLLLNSTENGLDPLSITPYELSDSEKSKLLGFIDQKMQEVANLEAKNSELVTSSNGDQFYRIKEFKKEGENIKSDLTHFIDATFSNYSDDRGKVFAEQLFKSGLYNDFGKTAKELSIDESRAPDGTIGNVFSMKKLDNGIVVDEFTNPFGLNLMKNRYSKIVQKHSPP